MLKLVLFCMLSLAASEMNVNKLKTADLCSSCCYFVLIKGLPPWSSPCKPWGPVGCWFLIQTSIQNTTNMIQRPKISHVIASRCQVHGGTVTRETNLYQQRSYLLLQRTTFAATLQHLARTRTVRANWLLWIGGSVWSEGKVADYSRSGLYQAPGERVIPPRPPPSCHALLSVPSCARNSINNILSKIPHLNASQQINYFLNYLSGY